MSWPITWLDEITRARVAAGDDTELEWLLPSLLKSKFDKLLAWYDLVSAREAAGFPGSGANPARMVAWSKSHVYFLARDSTGLSYVDNVPRNPPKEVKP